VHCGGQRYHRRSVRLSGYDYSGPGAYFVTICAHGRRCTFGEIRGAEVCLSVLGRIVREEWLLAPVVRKEAELDAWIVMPNHLHGILWIAPNEGGADSPRGESRMGACHAALAGREAS